MKLTEFILTYFVYSFLICGVMLGVPIAISDWFFEFEMVLKSKSDFIRCVFMWQFAVYDLLNEWINRAGIIIAEILATLVALPMNIMVFAILVICLAIKGICVCFYKVFRKRNEESEVSENG